MAFELEHADRCDEIGSVMDQLTTDIYNLHVDDRLDRKERDQ
jgi:hypothetical protein